MAEAIALLEGLQLAWDAGYRRVACEVDSEDLITTLQDSEAANVFMEISVINELLGRDWETSLIRITHYCNVVTDAMAKLAAASPSVGARVLDIPLVEFEPLILRGKMRVS